MIAIRPFQQEDFDVLLDLANQAVPFAARENAQWLEYRKAFDASNCLRRHYIATKNEKLLGYGCLEQQGDDPASLRIYVVCSPPNFQSEVGAMLYARLLQDAKALGVRQLWARELQDDTASCSFFAQQGFIETQRGRRQTMRRWWCFSYHCNPFRGAGKSRLSPTKHTSTARKQEYTTPGPIPAGKRRDDAQSRQSDQGPTDMTYPILEYDSTREAFIEPSRVIRPREMPEHCVICFFREVVDKLVIECNARTLVENRWEDGPHPVYEMEFRGKRLAFFHPGIGAALTAAMLEEVIAFGCRKFIACGGAGVLAEDIAVGHLIVVSAAVRDEGVSYHYFPPGRELSANTAGVDALVRTLDGQGVPYRIGKTWTTDAPYRETSHRIATRQKEGCLTVEMECAGMMAVAQFRDVVFGQVLYGGDDLSGTEWDNRGWQSKGEVRESLFWSCANACVSL